MDSRSKRHQDRRRQPDRVSSRRRGITPGRTPVEFAGCLPDSDRGCRKVRQSRTAEGSTAVTPPGNPPDPGISRNQCNAARRYAWSHGHRPDRSFTNPHDDAVLRPLEQRAVHGRSDPTIGKRGAQCRDLVQHERLHQRQPHHARHASGLRPVAYPIDFLCPRINLPGWMGEWLAELTVGCCRRSSRVDAVERVDCAGALVRCGDGEQRSGVRGPARSAVLPQSARCRTHAGKLHVR